MKLRWIPMLLLLLLLSTVPARAAGALHTAYLAGYPDGTIRPGTARRRWRAGRR